MRTKRDYEVIEYRQAWKLHEGRWYRESVIRRRDGRLRLAYVFDGEFGA